MKLAMTKPGFLEKWVSWFQIAESIYETPNHD